MTNRYIGTAQEVCLQTHTHNDTEIFLLISKKQLHYYTRDKKSSFSLSALTLTHPNTQAYPTYANNQYAKDLWQTGSSLMMTKDEREEKRE